MNDRIFSSGTDLRLGSVAKEHVAHGAVPGICGNDGVEHRIAPFALLRLGNQPLRGSHSTSPPFRTSSGIQRDVLRWRPVDPIRRLCNPYHVEVALDLVRHQRVVHSNVCAVDAPVCGPSHDWIFNPFRPFNVRCRVEPRDPCPRPC